MKDYSLIEKIFNQLKENPFLFLYHLFFFVFLLVAGTNYTSNLNQLNNLMIIEVSTYSQELDQELNKQLTKQDLLEYHILRHKTTESLIMFISLLLIYLMPKIGGHLIK